MRKLFKFFKVCTVLILWTAAASGEPGVGFSFDIDDNILFLPTKILVFKKGTEEFVPVGTREFAEMRSEIGQPGKWADYEIRGVPGGSFRYFAEPTSGDANYFVEALKEAMKGNDWKGPSFETFQMAMADPKTAAETTLITAREHDPLTMWKGFDLLRKEGYIENVPRIKNIWGVGGPNFPRRFRRRFGFLPPGGAASHPGPRKGALVQQLLSEISARPVPSTNFGIVAPDGKATGAFHLWGFSDDDRKNFQEARETVETGLNQGKWKNLKVALFYTGTADPDHAPEAVILVPNAEPRPLTPEEGLEWRRILKESTEGEPDPGPIHTLQALADRCQKR